MLSRKKMTPGARGGSDPSFFLLKLENCRESSSGHCTGSGLWFHSRASPSFYTPALDFSLHYGLHTLLVSLIPDCSRLLLFPRIPQELQVNYQPLIFVTSGCLLCMHSSISIWCSRIKDDLCLPPSNTKIINANTLIVTPSPFIIPDRKTKISALKWG